MPAIAAFGEAARVAYSGFGEYVSRMASLRALGTELLSQIPSVVINSPAEGAAHILSFSVPGVRSETMLHFLESRGVFVSSGSACSKGRRSAVLAAMGLGNDVIDSALRASFSRFSSEEDVRQLAEGVAQGASALRRGR